MPLDELNVVVESFEVVSWEHSNRACGGPGEGSEYTVRANSVLLLRD